MNQTGPRLAAQSTDTGQTQIRKEAKDGERRQNGTAPPTDKKKCIWKDTRWGARQRRQKKEGAKGGKGEDECIKEEGKSRLKYSMWKRKEGQ